MQLKINTRALASGLCAGFFVLFHISYYAGTAFTEIESPYGRVWETPEWILEIQDFSKKLLSTRFESPLSMSKLSLCEVEGGPRYWNPFAGVTYRYSEADTELEECNLSETSGTLAFSFLDVEFTQKGWDPESYWQEIEIVGFAHRLEGAEAPNLLFFLIQYSLVGGFFWSILGKRL